ncbi:helix-turn-helix domain-containing protein [Nanchangia anserum]|uniref:sugar-binding transcriptional regulator n=1 Tax=Nanchangia anserum TaxID=2692125 RepID=UPI0018838867|nr:sugar-binding domain-containing protein [Nanchangia anserum]QOX81861.1 helix-turn-helix domain-containing protein [Nanchangia anserum]
MHLLLKVAQMYYDEGATQAQIAREVGYSRPTISRLLTEARQRGIVTITISHPLERLIALEDALVDLYGLKAARVTDSEAGIPISESVGREAAQLLIGYGGHDKVIALSNGRSVAAVVRNMPRRHWARACVAQMIGSIGRGLTVEDSPAICRILADRIGGNYAQMPVPLMLESAALAGALQSEPQVAAALQLAAHADVALVGVGAVDASGVGGPILQPYITDEMAAEILALGAIGHICGHHFDARGRHIHTALCDRMIALDPLKLRDVPIVIGVAWEPAKARALKAAMAGGYLNTLVVDRETAELLLDED